MNIEEANLGIVIRKTSFSYSSKKVGHSISSVLNFIFFSQLSSAHQRPKKKDKFHKIYKNPFSEMRNFFTEIGFSSITETKTRSKRRKWRWVRFQANNFKTPFS